LGGFDKRLWRISIGERAGQSEVAQARTTGEKPAAAAIHLSLYVST
jgi:hypothetical protein